MLTSQLITSDIPKINFEKEWKKTLLYKISFGNIKPSIAWKNQLIRIKNK